MYKMLVTEKINGSNIAYDTEYTHSIREYYLYCVNLFKEQLKNITYGYNIIFGDINYEFNNNLPIKRVFFQYEHTLVKPGGRDSEGFQQGVIPIQGQEQNYLVRLCNYDLIKQSDLIIEYSLPNLGNVYRSNFYPHYNDHNVHVSPSLYNIDLNTDRPLDIITNFYDVNQPRRKEFLQFMPSIQNYTGVYNNDLANLYSKSKIIINIHQTDHHDTCEELRILPALRRGVIVISELSALQGLIPYQDHIIWAAYDDIPAIANKVLQDYESYHKKIFGNSSQSLFKSLEDLNQTEIRRGLLCLH